MKPKLSLAERMFTCTTCGMSLDRDVNAARNLAGLVGTSTRSCQATQKQDVEPTKTRKTSTRGRGSKP